MNLTSLIPDSTSISVTFDPITGEGGSGLTGLADRIASQDFGGIAEALGADLLQRIDAALPAEGGLPFAGAIGTLESLAGLAGAPPADLTSALERPLGEVGAVLERIPQLVETLSGVAAQVEAARGGDVTPLIATAAEGVLDLVQVATGPQLAALQGWQSYLFELADEIRDLIALGGTPEEIRQRLIDAALGRIADAILALAPEITGLLGEAGGFLGGLLPDVPGLNLEGLRDDAIARLNAILAAAEVDGPDIDALIDDYTAALRLVTDTIHNVLDDIEAAFQHPLLTPGAITATLQREIDRVAGIQIEDFSDVSATIEEFFVSIEEAIDSVDLSGIGESVDSFFGSVQDAVDVLDPATIQAEIDEVAQSVDETLDRVGETITGVTAQIQGWLSGLTDQIQAGIDQLGEVGPDGRFHFRFEGEIDGLFDRVDALIQGDPNDPGAFSIRGALEDFQAGVLGMIGEIDSALDDLIGQLIAARDQAATALEDVRTQIEAVDPQAVMDEANQALEDAFAQIGELDFNVVVDPVIAEIEKVRDELAQIDVSQLDGLLREALATALEVILSIDFEVEITGALMAEFDELLAVPRSILSGIGDKVNELIAKVTDISPEQLLAPIQEQIDRMTSALDVEIAPALLPLTEIYDDLIERVRALDPTQFLTPLVDAFGQVTAVVNGLEPETLLRPAQQKIDELGSLVASIDLDEPLTGVNAVFGDIDRFLEQVDPETLLAPLREPFSLINRTLEPLRPSELLAPVTDIMDQIGDFTDAITEPVTEQIRALFDQAVARADSLDPARLLEELGGPIQALRDRLDLLRPAGLLHALQQAYTPVRAGVSASDARTGSSFTARLEIGAPTLAFGAVMGRYERVIARVDAVLAGLDPEPLREGYQEAVARLEELLPLAIRDDITPSRLLTLIGLTDPAAWIDRLDDIYERILGKLNLLDPAQIIEPLAAIHDQLRAALAGIDIGLITERVEEVLARIGELISSISLESILEPVLTQLDLVKEIITSIDPAPLIESLGERFDQVIGLFDEFGPEPIIDALQLAWEGLADRVREMFDLETIAAPLIGIFEALQALLGGLDAGELIATIDVKLQALRDSLEEALERTAAAFRAMISAVPLRSGGASASISVG